MSRPIITKAMDGLIHPSVPGLITGIPEEVTKLFEMHVRLFLCAQA